MQAVMQGISHIGVVTGHLRSNGMKRAFDEHRSQQVLSLLDSAASSLKDLPGMSEADKIVSRILEAAQELVGHISHAADPSSPPPLPFTHLPNPPLHSSPPPPLHSDRCHVGRSISSR